MTPTLINSRKYDGSIHRSWEANLVERDGSLVVFEGTFKTEIRHKDIGIIRPGTVSREYYWLDRHYNVFRFFEPGGELKCLYCNINLPPVLEAGILDYIDLDLDILSVPDLNPVVLDEEEFESNSRLYSYPPDVIATAREAVQDVLELLGRGVGPFQS